MKATDSVSSSAACDHRGGMRIGGFGRGVRARAARRRRTHRTTAGLDSAEASGIEHRRSSVDHATPPPDPAAHGGDDTRPPARTLRVAGRRRIGRSARRLIARAARPRVGEQPGRIVAVTDESDETVLDITDLTDARGEQGLLGLAFHPADALAYVNYTDLAGDTVVAEVAIDRDRALRPWLAPGGPDGESAVPQPQRWTAGVRAGSAALHRPRRWSAAIPNGTRSTCRAAWKILGSTGRGRWQPFTVPPTTRSSTSPAPTRPSGRSDAQPLEVLVRRRTATCGSPTSARASSRRSTGHRPDAADAGRGSTSVGARSRASSVQRRPAGRSSSPLFVYDHAGGRCSISGGAVARGDTRRPQGWYVFGDYCTGQIWALDPTHRPSEPRVIEIARLGTLVAISEGPDRELFAISNAGTVAQFIPRADPIVGTLGVRHPSSRRRQRKLSTSANTSSASMSRPGAGTTRTR